MATLELLLASLPAPIYQHRRMTMHSVDGRLNMTVPYTDAETDFDDIGQEWATIMRHPERPVTYVRGPKLATATLRAHLIARDPNRSIEHVVDAINAFANSLVPIVIVYGQSMTSLARSGAWVIRNTSITVAKRVQGSNDARWADVTLDLLEAGDWDARRYVLPGPSLMVAPRTTAAGGVTPATYVWQQGDDLFAVAHRMYGDAARWGDIAEANGVRNPSAIKPGRILRLP